MTIHPNLIALQRTTPLLSSPRIWGPQCERAIALVIIIPGRECNGAQPQSGYLSGGKTKGTESATSVPQVNGVFPYSRSMACDEISQMVWDGWPLHILTLAEALADSGVFSS